MKSPTISRSQKEMVEALRKQVRLLHGYAQKVFIEKDLDYVGEIANKLRLLVTKFRSNQPLLLHLMNETGIHPTLTLENYPGDLAKIPTKSELPVTNPITLEEFLKIEAFKIRIPSGELIALSKVELIRALAEQAGGAHEDWDMDQSLSEILSSGIYIMGYPAAIYELQSSLDASLGVAKRFLEQYEKQEK